MRKSIAFTLMEIVLVVVIIGLLATLVLNKIAGRRVEAEKATAKAQISSLKGALSFFEMDCGRFPTTAEGLKALIEPPPGMPASSQWRGYLQDPRIPQDPWGRNYVYRCPGTVNTGGYDLFSLGSDSKEGTDDDIGNTK